MLSLGILAGLIYPAFAHPAEQTLIPALMLALTISLRAISFDMHLLKHGKSGLKAYAASMLMGVLTIILALLLLNEDAYIKGFIVIAFAPPAVGVIAFNHLFKGDEKLALVGSSIAYLISLVVTPAGIWYFTGGLVDPAYIFRTVVLLLAVPMLLSRIVKRSGANLDGLAKPVVNACFFIVSYAMIALNQQELVSKGLALTPVFVIMFARTFMTGLIAYYALKNRVLEETRITYSLFASFKNGGMATVLAYYLFGPAASIPAAVSAIFELPYIMLLGRISGKK